MVCVELNYYVHKENIENTFVEFELWNYWQWKLVNIIFLGI